MLRTYLFITALKVMNKSDLTEGQRKTLARIFARQTALNGEAVWKPRRAHIKALWRLRELELVICCNGFYSVTPKGREYVEQHVEHPEYYKY